MSAWTRPKVFSRDVAEAMAASIDRMPDVVADLYDAYNAHDPSRAVVQYAEAGAHEEVPTGRVSRGRSAIRDGLERFFAAFPDAHWEPEHATDDGRRAVVGYRLTGTLQAPLGPFSAEGQRLDIRGVHVLEVNRNDRIEQSADYWDAATFTRQMGAPRLTDAPRDSVVQPEIFRHAMRLLAGGVVVVTAVVEGRPWGLTVSACCSLTVDPPRILVSLDSRTVSWKSISSSRNFGVALLGAGQVAVAQACSATGKPKFIEEFVLDPDDVPDAEAPVVREALVHLDCHMEASYEIGDHRLIVGQVQAATSTDDGSSDPLVYFERRFRGIGVPLA